MLSFYLFLFCLSVLCEVPFPWFGLVLVHFLDSLPIFYFVIMEVFIWLYYGPLGLSIDCNGIYLIGIPVVSLIPLVLSFSHLSSCGFIMVIRFWMWCSIWEPGWSITSFLGGSIFLSLLGLMLVDLNIFLSMLYLIYGGFLVVVVFIPGTWEVVCWFSGLSYFGVIVGALLLAFCCFCGGWFGCYYGFGFVVGSMTEDFCLFSVLVATVLLLFLSFGFFLLHSLSFSIGVLSNDWNINDLELYPLSFSSIPICFCFFRSSGYLWLFLGFSWLRVGNF